MGSSSDALRLRLVGSENVVPGQRRELSFRRLVTSSMRGRQVRMVVGIVRCELHLPAAQSLKDKRQVVRSIKERVRERVRAAVAEVEFQDLWQRAAIGIAVVAAD